jgi:hypothetical protein
MVAFIMKAIKYAIWFVLLPVGIFYILPVVLFQIPCFQKTTSNVLSKYLEEQIGTKVNIDKVEFQFFDKLILKDVYLEDESGNIFFSAKKIVSGFDFFSLFQHQIRINSTQIDAFTFNLTRESVDSPLNVQYIIDAFVKRMRKIELSMRNFSLKRGNFYYRVKDKESTPGKFNSNDIHLSGIVAAIQLYEFNDMILKADIERLSFTEKSGFRVKRLSFDLVIDSNNMRVNQFDLRLPESHLVLKKIITDYNHSHSRIFTAKTHFNFQLEPSQINLKDVCSFIPVSSYFQSQLEIMGKFVGNLNNFKLTGLAVKEDNMVVNADMEIFHLNDPRQASIYANVKNSFITPLKIQKIASYFNSKRANSSLLVERLGKISFNGKISGNINRLNTNVDINSEVGNLQARIQFWKKGTTSFLFGKVSTFRLNICRLINNNNFGSVRLSMNLNSTFNNHWKDWKGNIEASIKEFNYKSFCLENVCLSGNFTSNSFRGSLKADSYGGQIVTNGFFLLKGKNSKLNFSTSVSNISFYNLYSNTNYKNSKLSFVVDANLIGNCIDNFTGNIALHRLKFSTDRCVYSVDYISVDAIALGENKKQLLLHSNILNGEIKGMYSIGGSMSKNKGDVLHVSFTKVDIGHAFKSLFIRAIDFGGIATGYITVKDVFHTWQLFTNIDVHQFVFNNVPMGDLTLHGKWDRNKQGIELNGKIVNGDNSFIDIDGFIHPMKKENSILFDVHNTEIAFLYKYLSNVLSDFSGRLTGKLRLFGDLSNLKLEGDVLVDNGIFGIKCLNTYYTFGDWIKCTPNEISIGNAMVYDKFGNKAIVNVVIKYNAFSNFRFASDFSCKNLLVFDATSDINPLFYGKAFVTGTATLSSNGKFLSIEALLCNNKNTTLAFDLAKTSDIADCDSKKKQGKKVENNLKEGTINFLKTGIYLDLIAKIDSDAVLKIITNPLLSNEISSIGNGNLQIRYSTKKLLEVFGKYTIERGKFNLDFYPIISRNFEIVKGSSVSFFGNPLTADLDVKASYSISDFMHNNVPINFIILLSGQLKSPNIKWFFEEEKAVKSEFGKSKRDHNLE